MTAGSNRSSLGGDYFSSSQAHHVVSVLLEGNYSDFPPLCPHTTHTTCPQALDLSHTGAVDNRDNKWLARVLPQAVRGTVAWLAWRSYYVGNQVPLPRVCRVCVARHAPFGPHTLSNDYQMANKVSAVVGVVVVCCLDARSMFELSLNGRIVFASQLNVTTLLLLGSG